MTTKGISAPQGQTERPVQEQAPSANSITVKIL